LGIEAETKIKKKKPKAGANQEEKPIITTTKLPFGSTKKL
jgi:hypothetical protein